MQGLSEALEADFKAAQRTKGLSAEQVCIAYDKSPTSSWAYQLFQGRVPFTIAMVPMWTTLTGAEHYMRWMGGLTGHITAPVPTASRHQHAADSVIRFGEFMKATAKAAEDNLITEVEFKTIEGKSRRAMSQIMAEVHFYRELANESRNSRVAKLRDAS